MFRKQAKAGGDFWDEDEELMDNTPQEFGAEASPTPEPEGPTPVQIGEEDEEDGGSGDLMSALKKSKKKKDQRQEQKKAEEEAKQAEQNATVQVKSKKEKEREKKEREKAKKKAQAERKKTAQKITPEKKQQPTPESETSESPEPEKKPEAPKDAKSKKKSAMVAALQKQLAAKKAAEQAQKEAEEEELRRLEEEQRQAEEEEQQREEARLRKKEKERQKREELRAQGKLLTKKQREQQQLQEKRRQQLLASGVKVEGLGGEADKPKKPVYGKKKKGPQQKQEDSGSSSVATPEPEPEPVKEPEPEPVKEAEPEQPEKEEVKEEEGDEVLDDWEAALDSDGEVKEDWEALVDDEEKEKRKEEEERQKKAAEEAAAAEAKKKAEEERRRKKEEEAKKKAAAEEASVLDKGKQVTAQRKAEINEKREERKKGALASASAQDLRSPICCILGHVDTGKTKLLDKVRQTNVQEGEAGGITQQIGATYFPIDAIETKTKVMEKYVKPTYNVPGLLVIDTPGHESFTNLRSRGSSLCNIAILVVDIMHGLEPQTLESIRLLRDRKTPFVVALNKIDRLYSWEATTNNSFRDSLAKQNSAVQREFQDRLEKTKLAFAEQGLNAEVYYQNKNLGKNVSLVPTSAVTGEGVPDLLYLLLELTQTRMSKQLMYLSHLEATVLEVKVVEGFGTTIDVVLSNGVLREGDRIVLCGQNGPIATNVRALLTPQPLRELRLKSAYVHHKEVKAALGVKIAANDLDKAVAGSRLLLVGPDDDEEDLMDDVMDDLTGLLDSVDKTGNGVCVQASTLGALEALLDFLKDMKIPVKNIAIGPVYKRDVMQASTMLEKAKEFAVMLCFDVKIDKEAEQYAEENGIKIFNADIIYHLFDEFTAYQNKLLDQRRKDKAQDAVYPCVLSTIQVINKRNPMIVGVDIKEGSIRIGTPISVVKNDPNTGEKVIYPLGKVVSLEVNHKSVEHIKKGNANAGVAMRLESGGSNPPTWGRHIDEKDLLYSHITRKSIDTLKDPAFRSSVPRDDWLLIKNLKPVFDIK